MKRSGIKRKRKPRMSEEDKLRRAEWFQAVVGKGACINCGRKRGVRIEGHHVVPKGVLKQYGVPAHAEIANEDQETLIWGVPAQDNGVPVCSECHERHTRPSGDSSRIPRHKLPASAIKWAEQRGLLTRIENEYPEGKNDSGNN